MPHQSPPQQEQQQQQAVSSQQPPAVSGTSGSQLQYPTQQQQQQQKQQLPPVFPNLNSMLGGFVGAQNFAALMAAPQNAQAAWLANPALFQQQLFMNQLMQHQAAQQQQQQHHHNQQQQDALSSGRMTNQPTTKAEPQSHANTTNTESNPSNSNHMLSAEV